LHIVYLQIAQLQSVAADQPGPKQSRSVAMLGCQTRVSEKERTEKKEKEKKREREQDRKRERAKSKTDYAVDH